jgi:hypothetical protein
MGCCGGKGKDFKENVAILARVEEAYQLQVWRGDARGLEILESLVDELQIAALFFKGKRGGKDKAEMSHLASLAGRFASELVVLLDKKTAQET